VKKKKKILLCADPVARGWMEGGREEVLFTPSFPWSSLGHTCSSLVLLNNRRKKKKRGTLKMALKMKMHLQVQSTVST